MAIADRLARRILVNLLVLVWTVGSVGISAEGRDEARARLVKSCSGYVTHQWTSASTIVVVTRDPASKRTPQTLHVREFNIQTGRMRKIGTLLTVQISPNTKLSPDGTLLLTDTYSEPATGHDSGKGQWKVIDIRSGRARSVCDLTSGNAVWEPDSRHWVEYLVDSGIALVHGIGVSDVTYEVTLGHLMPFEGHKLVLSTMRSICQGNLAFMYCGFIRLDSGEGRECLALVHLDSATAKIEQFMISSSPPPIGELRISPDGNVISALWHNGPQQGRSIGSAPRVTPSVSIVLFTKEGSRCQQIATIHGSTDEALHDSEKYQWSANGRAISYSVNGQLYVVNTDR